MGARRAASPARALGLVMPRTSLGMSAALALAALAASILATFVYGLVVDSLGLESLRPPEIKDTTIFPGIGILLTLQALAVVTPVSEEVLFRGFVLRGLLPSIGAGPAVVATALLFSVLHLEPQVMIPIFVTGPGLGVTLCQDRVGVALHRGPRWAEHPGVAGGAIPVKAIDRRGRTRHRYCCGLHLAYSVTTSTESGQGIFRVMGKERIERMFASVRERERPGLIIFLTAGFPDMEATLELVPALVAAGADAVELGVPFSDPLAEGPVIQQSSFLALQNGVTTADCLKAAETLRHRIPDAPLVLMGYYNPVLSYGIASFAAECQRVGVDGLITVDLPGTESGPLAAECDSRDLSLIPLLAPTSTEESIAESCRNASGFVYCVSVTGVTGC